MNVFTIIILFSSVFYSQIAFSAANTTSTHINNEIITNNTTYGANSVNHMGVPLNPYGAVSSSAIVPLEIQTPLAPDDLILPDVTPATETWYDEVVYSPVLNAISYLLIDAKTGNIIVEKNSNMRVPPASLVKMMLLYIIEQKLASGSIKLDQKVRVPEIAWHTAGSSMHLKIGQEISIEDLIKGTIVASGNDAAVTLAMAIAGTQENFVNIMNFTAKKLGMNNTYFSNVMGLPSPNLYTSARDLAILAQHIIYDYPEYYHYYSMLSIDNNDFLLHNYNKLLNLYPYADGIKTGSTTSIGYSLVSSAVKFENNRLISVVIGSENLMQSAYDSQTLLEYGFSNFETKLLYHPNHILDEIKVYKGEKNTVNIGVQTPIFITLPVYVDVKDIKIILHKIPRGLIAPVLAGTNAGFVEITYQGKIIQTFQVVALDNDNLGSFWQQINGTVSLWFT